MWIPQPHWLAAFSWSLSPGRVTPPANIEVLPNPERARSHPRIRKLSISLRPQQPWSRDGDSPCLNRPAGYGNPNPAHWMLSDIEIPRTECWPTGQLRSPAAPGEDRLSSADKKSFYECTIRNPGDGSGDPAGRYRPERRGNLHASGWLLIGRGSWRQRARRFAPLANFEDLSHPETIWSHQMRNSSTSLNLSYQEAETEIPRVDSAPHGVETPTPLVGCFLMEPEPGKSYPSGQR